MVEKINIFKPFELQNFKGPYHKKSNMLSESITQLLLNLSLQIYKVIFEYFIRLKRL
jgi:hypothetical protein